MVEEGIGLDVAGGGEILTAIKAGIDPALIVLHGNAKSDEEISIALEHGVGLVVVDNSDDVDRLEALVPQGRIQDVLVRIIPGVTADTHAHVLTGHEGSKFGLSPADAAPLIKRIEQSERVRMQGLHVHVGSQILDVEPFAESVAPVAKLGEFPIYDLGGGLGARYTWADNPPAIGDYLESLIGAAREHLPAEAQVIIETGSQHGLRDRCHDLPGHHRQARQDHLRRRGRRDGRQPRGRAVRAAVRGRHRRVASKGPDLENVTVVGRHCESGDVLVDGVDLSSPAVGDLLAIPATGAYCFTMSNNYNGNRRIPVVFASDGQPHLVVRRETWEDLSARDVDS